MLNKKKIAVVLPAYNAEKTLEKTISEVDRKIVDILILVDDKSSDNTVKLARKLGLQVLQHEKNLGYGGNQKTCYDAALRSGADIIVMLHPDYQYTPLLIPSMCSLIALGVYPVVFGSRILGNGALRGGMPRYKYVANRLLTLFENILAGRKLSEYHTGYRAYSKEVLLKVDYRRNSDDFIFDNQMISQIFMAGFDIAEITCPTKYFDEASSINFGRSVKYGFGVIKVSLMHFLHRTGIYKFALYTEKKP